MSSHAARDAEWPEDFLRHESALRRAHERIRERVEILREQGRRRRDPYGGRDPIPANQAILHFVPLFPPQGPWNYSDDTVAARLRKVRAFGYRESFDRLRFTQLGAFSGLDNQRHVAFLRDGSLEFQLYDVIGPGDRQDTLVFVASDLEEAISEAFADARDLVNDKLLLLPVVIQLHLLDVQGARLKGTRRWSTITDREMQDPDMTSDTFLLADWTDGPSVLRRLIDHVWQAWGESGSPHFDSNGELNRFDADGALVQQR